MLETLPEDAEEDRKRLDTALTEKKAAEPELAEAERKQNRSREGKDSIIVLRQRQTILNLSQGRNNSLQIKLTSSSSSSIGRNRSGIVVLRLHSPLLHACNTISVAKSLFDLTLRNTTLSNAMLM